MNKPFSRSANVKLPDKVNELLSTEPDLHSEVLAAISDFSPIFSANKTPFFPEYTDHGINHVETVIATSWWLASEQAKGILSAQDAAVLVLACILHDLGMHLDKRGLHELMTNSNFASVPWFRDQYSELPWKETWYSFCDKMQRNDSKANLKLFGTSDPVNPPNIISDEDVPWTDLQYLYVGEFIRQHHGRMAHEFALSGFPPLGSKGCSPILENEALADLAGVVARSHSNALRDGVEYIENCNVHFHNIRDPHSVHAPFLMMLLRVADFLHLEPDRANQFSILLKKGFFRSPISTSEHNTHLAVRQIRITGEDAEALEIDCLPKSCSEYLNLKTILNSIQHELDQSWAVLGEVYSRQPQLSSLGLVLRRVRSNLDDTTRFEELVGDSFIPVHASFRSDDARLLNLLVGPLYGDDKTIALRELLQNAVDAVRERQESRKSCGLVPLDDHGADVLMQIDLGDDPKLIVRDQGVGMTIETIKNYFLTAGASFRMSDAWREEYETAEGDSNVLRSGRFGVGALAAFMLGDEICVVTRHHMSTTGVRFTATIDSDPIEFVPDQDAEIGTKITVPLSKQAVKDLRFSKSGNNYTLGRKKCLTWYFLDSPSFELKISNNGMTYYKIEHNIHLPDSQCSTLPEKWTRLHDDDYEDIHWTYEDGFSKTYCNGILIPGSGYKSDDLFEVNYRQRTTPNEPRRICRPTISIFDNNGRFPLTLDRMDIAGDLPFRNGILKQVVKEIANRARNSFAVGASGDVDGGSHYAIDDNFWASVGNCIIPKWSITSLEKWPSHHILNYSSSKICTKIISSDSNVLYTPCKSGDKNIGYTLEWIRDLYTNKFAAHQHIGGFLLLGNEWLNGKNLLSRMPAYLRNGLVLHSSVQNSEIFCFGDYQSADSSLISLLEKADATAWARVMLLHVPKPPAKCDREPFVSLWREAVGDGTDGFMMPTQPR